MRQNVRELALDLQFSNFNTCFITRCYNKTIFFDCNNRTCFSRFSYRQITELQPSGKKRMSCSQFLRGTKPEIGTKLGENAANSRTFCLMHFLLTSFQFQVLFHVKIVNNSYAFYQNWNEVRRKCMRQNVRELALDGLIQVEKSGAYSNFNFRFCST
jgi:hypothetical protein